MAALYPVISHTADAVFSVNFGDRPFVYAAPPRHTPLVLDAAHSALSGSTVSVEMDKISFE